MSQSVVNLYKATVALGTNAGGDAQTEVEGSSKSANKVRIFAQSDQDSAALGIKLQQSLDGATYYTTDEVLYTSPNAVVLSYDLATEHFKVQYNNVTSAAATLQLAVSLVYA